MLHGVVQGVAVQDVDVHVEAVGPDVGIEDAGQRRDLLLERAAEALRDDGVGERDSVLGLVERELRH